MDKLPRKTKSSKRGSPSEVAASFLRTLWPDPPVGFFLLWLKDGKRSLWFPSGDLEGMAAAAAEHASQTDVYFGCGLSPRDNGPRNRCRKEDVIAIPGLWADVDFRGDAHKKIGLPPDADSALSLIQAMPLPPSLVVYSGHGLQPWWLFKEPWLFDGEQDRRQAAALLVNWQSHFRLLAGERGWELDSVHDLARILRPPGTMNRKTEPFVPVQVTLPAAVPRYDPSDLQDALPDADAASRNGSPRRRTTAEWERVAAGVDEGERHDDGVAFIGKILGMVRDLSGDEQIAFAWSLVKNWNSACNPPQPEKDLRRDFDDILGRERRRRKQAASPPEPWEEPLPLGELPEVEPLPLDVLPAPAKRLVQEISWAMNCPPDLAGVALLALAGGAIANARHLAITDTHVVSPCLYAVVVAPPGMVKSPPLRLLRRPFDLAESQYRKDWKAALQAWKESDKEDRGPKPVLKRCLVSNTTTESLQIILDENPRGVLMIRNELSGLVAGLNQYKSGGGDDRQFYLDLWDGTPIITDRKSDRSREGAPVFVLDAFTTIYGTIQPDLVAAMRTDAGRRRAGVNDGWLDRYLFAYPRGLPAVGEQWRAVSAGVRSAWEDAVNELLSLRMREESGKPPRPVLLKLSAEGCASWQRFTERMAAEMNGEDFPPQLCGPWVKLRAYGARLALILRCLRWAYRQAQEGENDSLDDVDGESMEGAARLVAYFKSHARKVYAVIDADPRHREAKRALRWLGNCLNSLNCLKGSRVVSRSELHAGVWGGSKDVDEVSDVIALLCRYGWLRLLLDEAKKGPGRHASPRYEVHPSVSQNPSDISDNSENCSREPGQEG